MKLSSLFYGAIVAATPVLGRRTKVQSRSINDIILDEERYVLFNSRQLTGDCLSICVPGNTPKPSISPTMIPTTSPSGSPTSNNLTGGPTGSPTNNPTRGPTELPTNIPTGEPTGSPINNPTGGPTDVATTNNPTESTTAFPTSAPTEGPTGVPTATPTRGPTRSPTNSPTGGPTDVATTNNPTESTTAFPTSAPTEGPTGAPTDTPTGGPTKSPTNNPTGGPTNVVTTNNPTESTTAFPTSAPTESTDNTPPPPELVCEDLVNLGYGFSEATGSPHYSEKCYPAVVGLDANNIPGRDDSVAVFVGGSYFGIQAAEVEGRVVVLGNLEVHPLGPSNFVSVGAGTHVLPNNGGDCIIVGGDISADREIQVFNQNESMYCDIVFRGHSRNSYRWKTNGDMRHVPDYDLTHYEQMKYILAKKSQYWKTLPSTAEVELQDSTTTYQCSNNDEIQVFNIRPHEHEKLNTPTAIAFSDNCEDKTILINVHGTGDIGVNAAGTSFKGQQGRAGFSTCLTQNILWNFPDATSVDIGNGASSEFHGSLLIGGNLKLSTSGHSGRTMVLGDVYHDSGSGSEFHSYPFAPPTPLPDPEDICVLPEDWRSYDVGTYPPAPTESPTPQPIIEGCQAIPSHRLPQSSPVASDDECRLCEGPNPVTYYPCDLSYLSTPICEGQGCVFSG